MIPLLAAAALLLLLTATGKKTSADGGGGGGGGGGGTAPPPVDASKDPTAELTRIMSSPAFAAELGKLRTADSTLFGWVTTLLAPVMTNNPVYIAGYAAAAYGKGYPTIAQALSARFLMAVHKTVGKSGQEWFTWTGQATPDKNGFIAIDVLLGSTPVLSYMEKLGTGGTQLDPTGFRSTRKLIGVALDPSKFVNPGDMQKILDNAKMDFGPSAGVPLS